MLSYPLQRSNVQFAVNRDENQLSTAPNMYVWFVLPDQENFRILFVQNFNFSFDKSSNLPSYIILDRHLDIYIHLTDEPGED